MSRNYLEEKLSWSSEI